MTKLVDAQTYEARIADLEARYAALEQRLAAVEPKPTPPLLRDRPVLITRPLPPPVSMPSDAELAELLRRVRERYATFRPSSPQTAEQEQQYFEMFKGSFRWLISVGRTQEPNRRYDYSAIVEKCRGHLQMAGAGVPVNYGSIVAAAIATGDIVFDDPITAPFPWCYLGINPDVPSNNYAGEYRQILAGERDFLPSIAKGFRPRQESSGPGYETSIPHRMRAQGLLP